MCCVVKRLLPCGCPQRIVEGGAGSSLQTGGVWPPKNTFVWLVEVVCEDNPNDSSDTGRSYLAEENGYRIPVKF